MSKFLILSEGGDGCGLALRLIAEGHEARIWIREPQSEHYCAGLVERAENFNYGEIMIADCTGFGSILDAFRQDGRLTFGGSSLHDRLENDREYAKQIMSEAGIETPESVYLTGQNAWEEAKNILANNQFKRAVFKPGGHLSGNVPSYVPDDNMDLSRMLKYFEKKSEGGEAEFELQEFKDGIAISTEGWFNGKGFVGHFNHTIERKQLMCGDLGPTGGCTGNLVWLVSPEEDDPLVGELRKLTEFLAEHKYIGPIDLNAVVSENGEIYGLEFTPRFGYDAFPTYLYGLFQGNFGAFVRELSTGGSEGSRLSDQYAAGIRLSIHPWPDDDHMAAPGIPISGFLPEDQEFFYPYDIAFQDDEFSTSGGWGVIGVVVGTGATPGEAFARAYQRAKRIKIPGVQYRTDLGKVCYEDFRKLEVMFSKRDPGWIGVDLDKTLAKGSPKEIGEPVPAMLSRVRKWHEDGEEVRILTARANDIDEQVKTYDWLREQELPLHVTSQKDHEMKKLWDDRAVQVEVNTGQRA